MTRYHLIYLRIGDLDSCIVEDPEIMEGHLYAQYPGRPKPNSWMCRTEDIVRLTIMEGQE